MFICLFIHSSTQFSYLLNVPRQRHKPHPITIINRRWDPWTATTSAAFDGALDITRAMANIGLDYRTEYTRALTRPPRKKQNETGKGIDINTNTNTDTEIASSRSALQASSIAVGKGFGKVGIAMSKTAIDLPLAFADGFHALPALYGEKPREYEQVRDWKSGGIKGAKVCFSSFPLFSSSLKWITRCGICKFIERKTG